MAYDNSLVDKRVVERNIAKGLVDRDQFKQQIDALPDREANCVHVSLDGGADDDALARSASLDDDMDDADDVDDDADDLDDEDEEDADDEVEA